LPFFAGFAFTFASMQETDYLLGQCPQCHTIFWEQAQPTSPRRALHEIAAPAVALKCFP
jgi:hypothetical protein